MNPLKPVIQDASNRMNNPSLDNKDDMQWIKIIVAIDRHAIEAISSYKAHQENIVGKSGNTATPIITAEEIRKDMQEQYRPIIKTEDEMEK